MKHTELISLIYLSLLYFAMARYCPDHANKVLSLPSFTEIPCMYSGFLPIDEKDNAQLFYWLILSKDKSEDKPLILWLNGGPGSSSLFGLFTEMGPLRVGQKGMTLEEQYTWTSKANIVYVDQPVGTGYSFSDKPEHIPKDEATLSNQFYFFLQKFFNSHKDLVTKNFYIIGESYAGKYIPNIAKVILEKNSQIKVEDIYRSDTTQVKINLKKIAIGNGIFDARYQRGARLDLAKGVNILSEFEDESQFNLLVKNCEFASSNNKTNSLEACDKVLNFVTDMAGDVSEYDIRKSREADSYLLTKLNDYLNNEDVVKNLHVKNTTIKTFPYWSEANDTVKNALKDDINLVSSIPIVEKLLDDFKFPVLIYAGQFDLVDGPQGIERALFHMNHNDSHSWRESPKELWKIVTKNEGTIVGGYVKQFNNLVFITMRNAGHFAPRDRIMHSLNLLDHLFTDETTWKCPDDNCLLYDKKCKAMNNCNNNGVCDKSTGGKCKCNKDFFGPDCGIKSDILKSNSVYKLSPRDTMVFNLSHYNDDILLEISSENHEVVTSLLDSKEHEHLYNHQRHVISYTLFDHKLVLFIEKEKFANYMLVVSSLDYKKETSIKFYINDYRNYILFLYF